MSRQNEEDQMKIGVIIKMFDTERNHNIPGFVGKTITYKGNFNNEEVKEIIQNGLRIKNQEQIKDYLLFQGQLKGNNSFMEELLEIGQMEQKGVGTIQFQENYNFDSKGNSGLSQKPTLSKKSQSYNEGSSYQNKYNGNYELNQQPQQQIFNPNKNSNNFKKNNQNKSNNPNEFQDSEESNNNQQDPLDKEINLLIYQKNKLKEEQKLIKSNIENEKKIFQLKQEHFQKIVSSINQLSLYLPENLHSIISSNLQKNL